MSVAPQKPGRVVSFLLDISTREAEVTHVEAVGAPLPIDHSHGEATASGGVT